VKLEHQDTKKLLDATREAFDSTDLELLLFERFGLRYANIAAATLRDDIRALKLVQYFENRYETERLVAAFYEARPRVPAILELAETVGILPKQDALQVLARPITGEAVGVDPAAFRAALALRERSICRITVGGTRYGTGMLVADDLVLTNHHVVARALAEDGRLIGVVCEFDYRRTATAYVTPGHSAKALQVLACRSHAPEDLTGGSVSALDRLDYAILKLDSAMGRASIVEGGDDRGFTGIPAQPPTLAEGQAVLLLQHPNAEPLSLDLGSTEWFGQARIRHSANTKGGSSGAPVFDVDLAPVALHHAGYDWPEVGRFENQAIPMRLIAADARSRGVAI
jgi:hypothetical protein